MSENLLDHKVIATRYFFPRPLAAPSPLWVEAGDAQLRCWYSPASPGQKTFLHFHGNGEVVADYIPDYTAAVRAMGVGVFMAEYRGYGGSSGAPQMGKMLDDVGHVVSALGEQGVSPSDMVVYGRSVGSIFAIELAHQHPDIAGLILESGISDVLQRLLLRMRPAELNTDMTSLTAAIYGRMNHQQKLAAYMGPLMVMHARDDDLVTPDHAERNHGWAGSEDKDLVWFDRGGHNGLMAFNFPTYLSHLRGFLERI